MEKRILLVGGGGHCHSVLDSICSNGDYDRIGIVARDESNYQELQNDALTSAYLIGIDAELPKLLLDGWREAFVTLGSIGNPIGRQKIYLRLVNIGFHIPVIKDNSAVVSKYSTVDNGTYVGKNVVINAGSKIGACAIVNTGATVEHDCVIGDFVHVSPGAVLCGGIRIADYAHIGAGSVVRQGIAIGERALIGIGSVVVKDIPDNVKAYGNPCRVVK